MRVSLFIFVFALFLSASCALSSQKAEYKWETGAWEKCSKVCGGGSQSRVVMCESVDALDSAPEKFCNAAALKKPVNVRACNTEACPVFVWHKAKWSKCSKKCGHGTKKRVVTCQHPATGAVVSSDVCTAKKPRTEKHCKVKTCPPTWSYKTGKWGKCSAKCDGGVRVRKVTCISNRGKIDKADDACDTIRRPADSQECNTQDCPDVKKVTVKKVAGARGSTGAAGPKGKRGPRGDKGSKGDRGVRGVRGGKGPRGSAGDKGPRGKRGARGLTGSRGPHGKRGKDGKRGKRGHIGATGPRGPVGKRGKEGYQGPMGKRGVRGDYGPRGLTGVRGPRGAAGARGKQGKAGVKGARGEQGPEGPRGAAGPEGRQGLVGAQGPNGAQGAQGPAGPNGGKGPRGDKGPDGAASKEVLDAVAKVSAHDAVIKSLQAKIARLEAATGSSAASFAQVGEVKSSLGGLKSMLRELQGKARMSRQDQERAEDAIDRADIMTSLIQAEAKLI